MPKGRKIVKVDGRITKTNVKRKLRIGNRKTGVSALSMTTEALKSVIETKSKKKYHANAKVVLQTRGVEL